MSTPPTESVADLIRTAQERYGLSQREVAEALGRSPRMVRKVLRGETRGESYRQAVEDLNTTGEVSAPPERRRNARGKVVPVRVHESKADRAKREAAGIKTAPTAAPGFKAPSRFTHKVSYADNGDRLYRSTMKAGSKESEQRYSKQLTSDLRSITKSQRSKDKRISFSMRTASGETINIGTKGGYFSSDVLKKVNNEFGGDVHKYLIDQVNKTNKYKLKPGDHISEIQMNVSDAKGMAHNTRKR